MKTLLTITQLYLIKTRFMEDGSKIVRADLIKQHNSPGQFLQPSAQDIIDEVENGI